MGVLSTLITVNDGQRVNFRQPVETPCYLCRLDQIKSRGISNALSTRSQLGVIYGMKSLFNYTLSHLCQLYGQACVFLCYLSIISSDVRKLNGVKKGFPCNEIGLSAKIRGMPTIPR